MAARGSSSSPRVFYGNAVLNCSRGACPSLTVTLRRKGQFAGGRGPDPSPHGAVPRRHTRDFRAFHLAKYVLLSAALATAARGKLLFETRREAPPRSSGPRNNDYSPPPPKLFGACRTAFQHTNHTKRNRHSERIIVLDKIKITTCLLDPRVS